MLPDDSSMCGGAIAIHGPDSTVINSRVDATLRHAANLLQQGDRDGARHLVAQVDSVVEMADGAPAPALLIGRLVFFCRLLITCGLSEKANEVFTQIAKYNDLSDPTSLETIGDYCQIGQLFLNHGNRASAKTAFKKAKDSLLASSAVEASVYLARVKQVLAEL